MENVIIHSHQKGQGTWRYTIVGVHVSEGRFDVGVAVCAPEDNFDRKKGVKIAKGRAQRNPLILGKTRQEIFDEKTYIRNKAHKELVSNFEKGWAK